MSRQAASLVHPLPQSEQAYALSSDDVRQLTHILARLGVTEVEHSLEPEPAKVGGLAKPSPGTPLARAKWIYHARQRRSRFFPGTMFGEAGWDILLVLYIHDGMTRLRITDVGRLIDSPATTILRWLKILEEEDLISVRKHQLDGRVSILGLTSLGRTKVAAYLDEAGDN